MDTSSTAVVKPTPSSYVHSAGEASEDNTDALFKQQIDPPGGSGDRPTYTIEDVPSEELQFWLRLHVRKSKLNTLITLVGFSFGNIPWAFFSFVALTKSILIAGTVASIGFLFAYGALLAKSTSQTAIKFYVQHPDVAKKIGEQCKVTVYGGMVFMLILAIVTWIFIIEPFRHDYFFGTQTYILVTTTYWVNCLFMIPASVTTPIDEILPQHVATVWKQKITNYFERAVHELLQVESGKASVMQRLEVEQMKVEEFAIDMNETFSFAFGYQTLMNLLWIFINLALIAMPSQPGNTIRGTQLGVLSFMVIWCSISMVVSLRALTAPNFCWEKERKRLLNGARIQSLVGVNGEYNFERFDVWLSEHELKAQKAFGVQITQQLARRFGSLLVSTVAVLMYILLREELRALLS